VRAHALKLDKPALKRFLERRPLQEMVVNQADGPPTPAHFSVYQILHKILPRESDQASRLFDEADGARGAAATAAAAGRASKLRVRSRRASQQVLAMAAGGLGGLADGGAAVAGALKRAARRVSVALEGLGLLEARAPPPPEETAEERAMMKLHAELESVEVHDAGEDTSSAAGGRSKGGWLARARRQWGWRGRKRLHAELDEHRYTARHRLQRGKEKEARQARVVTVSWVEPTNFRRGHPHPLWLEQHPPAVQLVFDDEHGWLQALHFQWDVLLNRMTAAEIEYVLLQLLVEAGALEARAVARYLRQGAGVEPESAVAVARGAPAPEEPEEETKDLATSWEDAEREGVSGSKHRSHPGKQGGNGNPDPAAWVEHALTRKRDEGSAVAGDGLEIGEGVWVAPSVLSGALPKGHPDRVDGCRKVHRALQKKAPGVFGAPSGQKKRRRKKRAAQ
jgi:hypothetical protein